MTKDEKNKQVRDLARVIAGQAQAIADGRPIKVPAMAALILNNAETLKAWALEAELTEDKPKSVKAHELGIDLHGLDFPA